MKNMNPIFSLKNFRSFGEEGADFELAPITVLTGCNSAGKSSLVKAILLLSKENRNTNFGEIGRLTPSNTLPVSAQDLALGRFDKVLNANAKNGTIELSYCIWSNYLQETVKVTRRYQTHVNDVLNNGRLISYTIKKLDGTIIYKYPKYINVDFGDESYFDEIQNNYNVFQSALEYLIKYQLIENQLHKTIDVDHESAYLKELREKVDELKNRMQGHPLEDFGHSLHEWYVVMGKRKEKHNASLYHELMNLCELIRIEEKSETIDKKDLAKHLAKQSASKIEEKEKEEKENENEYEKNKELYVTLACNEVIQPPFLQDVVYADSSSASIKRLYSIEDNSKLCSALRKMYYRKLSDKDVLFTNYAGSFLNKWMKEFDLGEKIEVEGTEQGLGMLVYLKQKNGDKRLLADEGYGITQLVSLLLYIDNIIPSDPNAEYKGYGEWEDGYKPRYICVEEPENHLHPKFQSKLAEMFVEAYQKYNIHFIIETHSEYLIRKLQVMVADKKNALLPSDVSLNYVEKEGDGVSANRKIEIGEDGRLSEPFGKGFLDEADSLAMEILKLKPRKK